MNNVLGHPLGSGNTYSNWEPKEVGFKTEQKLGLKIRQFSAGNHHVALLTKDDFCYFWGANQFG